MPSSMSPTRIITFLSLVALSALSFALVFGTDTLSHDTLARDSLFSTPKSNNVNVLHHRRAFHHARASVSAAPSGSNPPPPPSVAPSQPPPSSAVNSQASSPPAVSSPAPSSQSSPAPQSFSSSPSPSAATSPSPVATSAPTSSLAPSSSSPSPSPSNTPAASSRLVTSSSIGAVSSNANPTTAFFNSPNSVTSRLAGPSLTTSGGSTVTIAASSTAGAASSSGFFKNKAAVGVTFSIVGIVGGLAVIMAVLTFLRRHRRSREAIEDEEFFEKYPSGDGDFGDVPHTPPGFGTASIPESSTSAAPLDAYPDRAVHYGQPDPSTVLNPVDYGIAYPPSAAASGGGNAYEHVEPSHSLPPASHPFADPANASFTTTAPPVTFPRPFAGRAQEMVTTDSYYGPNSAGVGSGVGYAQ